MSRLSCRARQDECFSIRLIHRLDTPQGLQKRTRKQLVLHVVERHVVAQEIIALKEWHQNDSNYSLNEFINRRDLTTVPSAMRR